MREQILGYNRCDVLSSDLLIFLHLCHDILLSFSRCFAIAHVGYPTLTLNVIVRCVVLSFGVLLSLTCYFVIIQPMFYHLICLMFCHLDCFVVLTKKHKPTKIYEPNYGYSDSLKGIRRWRLLWGLIEHIFVKISFFSP